MTMEKSLALIVEDNEDVAYIFSEAAEEAGFQTEIIMSGDEALKRLASVIPTLVILDLHLPQVHGEDILAQIRSDPRLEKTRVIVATADASKAEELNDIADLVLLKPIGFFQLRDLAARMGKPRSP